MNSSKLVLLFQTFQPEEMRWMSKFVRSPFYNSNEKVVELFDYIRKYYPNFGSPKLEKEKVFDALFPSIPFDDQRLRLLMFRLSEVAEQFLVANRLRQQPFLYQKHLIDELESRSLDSMYEKKSKQLSAQLNKEPFRDHHYHEAMWRLNHQLYFFHNKERKPSGSHSLASTLHHFDAFYFLSKLRYAGELFNRQNIFTESHHVLLLSEIRELIEQAEAFKDKQIFRIYQDVLLLMENNLDETVYDRLEDNFVQHLHQIRPADQASLIRYLINSTIQLYQNGRLEYLNRQFRLYQLGLDNGLFFIEQSLPESTFLNIVITATVLKETVWARNFIEDYQKYLPEQDQHDASHLARAYCSAASGNYLESNQLLHQVSRTGMGYMLRVKSLSLRNYFELFLADPSYFELFLYESKSFEKYIRRNRRISANRALGYQNFIQMLRKIGKLRSSQLLLDKTELDKLKEEISSTEVLVAKKWLLDKLTDLS
ncbi:MAG: hypothetical protein AAF587_34840 [Bacteroidota bacterium]